MKTLDVQALHNAIDQTLEQLKQQSDEFAKVKKAVEGITSLDDALKGKGGDAIRAFYEECHTPFLQFYDAFIEEYSSTLKKMKSALNSLEPNHNGFISQSFLEHELENGLNAADRTTKNLVSKTNATIAKVSHIVDLPDLNDSGFHEQNQKALKEISTTLEKLHAFDREQTNALKTAENDLETMQRYIARLEKMYTGPKIEITGYQKGAILKPDEMDTLSGNQETAMGAMLKKVGDKEDADINTLSDPDRLKKLATQKVSKKEYTQEELNELKKDYRVFNDTLYRAYIDGDTIVKIEPAYTLPENVEKSDFAKYFDTAMEFTGVYDAVRAAFGYDLATGEIVKDNGDRLMAGLSVTPFGKAFKYGKRGFKLFKGEEAGKKVAKVDKTPSYGKQSVPKGPYREVNGFPAKVKPGAQEKHIPGTPNYKQEIANGRTKSIFYGDNKKAQELLDKYAGTGEFPRKGREVVDFGQKIGKAYDMKTGKYIETTRGTIHYSKDGAHIVPAKPLEP
ncbi:MULTISPECIES: T7SS effector LXG polymorphic toxin [Bacillus]|uniref:T7SS effector LXG polymorphic toxin n=1 Tax=Bacillus TaxID=1386 RepID=UPI0022357761|nr:MULTISPECIES: T7SS effector LXG polymorphic toxin [Bacillus]MCW4364030.1 transposase [Bacillus paralicheniformis]MCY7774020.1 T7SS effector LXG polymorphic toxin [Bacillus licheniformis]MCY7913230.1 T7SS effector LXG polymorphic toxin [Bacillus haynesii]MCY7926211.1 T7SS effector LXG polymorphic toxin [Bacillus haynesii]MCY8531187.1 T7SS effector LXG polymorphic toxin [Bacillus licheniformis]